VRKTNDLKTTKGGGVGSNKKRNSIRIKNERKQREEISKGRGEGGVTLHLGIRKRPDE